MKILPVLLLSLAACAPKVEVTLLSIAGENDPVLSRIDFVVKAGDRIATISDQEVQLPRIETLVLPEPFEGELLNIEAVAFIGDKEVGRGAADIASGQTEATLLFALCSNGATEGPELCDDGNLTDGDGCDSTCRPTGCNSGVFTAGEVCFEAQNALVANAPPSDVRMEDMNGDQLLDLIAMYPTEGKARVFFGSEDNQFGDFVEVNADDLMGLTGSGDDLRQISVLDLDGDQTLDFATSAKVGGAVFVGVLLNKGDASFTAGDAVFAGNDIRDVALADLDGDQLPEILALDFPSNTLRIFKSLGGGVFETSFVSVPTDPQPTDLVVVDLDQDGDTDALTANASGTVSVLINDAGVLTPKLPAINTNGIPLSLATSDFNGDGLIDVVVSKQAGAADLVGVFRQNPDVSFLGVGDFSTPEAPSGLSAADIDLDGDIDLAVTSQSDSTMAFLLNNGQAQFDTPIGADRIFNTTQTPIFVTSGDINRDGLLDFVTVGKDLGLIFSTP